LRRTERARLSQSTSAALGIQPRAAVFFSPSLEEYADALHAACEENAPYRVPLCAMLNLIDTLILGIELPSAIVTAINRTPPPIDDDGFGGLSRLSSIFSTLRNFVELV
jgi:hypothetical protein